MSEKEFSEKVLPVSNRLYSVSYRILESKEDSEDAVQEVMIRLWNMRTKLKEYSSIEALGVTMIRNYSIDIIRKRRPGMTEGLRTIDGKSMDVPSPYDILAESETRGIVADILDNMPKDYSDLIRQHDIEGFDYREIAAERDQNVNSLRVTISRARKMLRDEYRRLGYDKRATKGTA